MHLNRNSEFLYHEPCPNCGSRNNLAVYTDHKYCFGCGHTVGVKRKGTNETRKNTTQHLALPYDCEPYIPGIAHDWLKQYDLTTNELLNNRVLWSEIRKLLVFPYFGENDNQVLGWQGRYFGDNPNHPKWFTKGYIKEFIKLIDLKGNAEHGIIFVEDIISAIKVGRQYACVPVFGSYIPKTHSIRINKLYGTNNFTIWLDRDKRKESYKFSKEITNMGFNSRVISTELDPKLYNNINIYNIYNNKEINN